MAVDHLWLMASLQFQRWCLMLLIGPYQLQWEHDRHDSIKPTMYSTCTYYTRNYGYVVASPWATVVLRDFFRS